MAVSQPTPKARATPATESPSRPTAMQAASLARSVSPARAAMRRLVSVHVATSQLGSWQRHIHLRHRSRVAGSENATSRTSVSRRPCETARTRTRGSRPRRRRFRPAAQLARPRRGTQPPGNPPDHSGSQPGASPTRARFAQADGGSSPLCVPQSWEPADLFGVARGRLACSPVVTSQPAPDPRTGLCKLTTDESSRV